jgi:hypothetical protein
VNGAYTVAAVGVSRRVLLIVVLLALAGGAAGCGSSGGSAKSKLPRYPYPAKLKQQFLDACQVHSKKSLCECLVEAYESTIPPDIYEQITSGGVRLNNRVYFQAFTQAASHCQK